MVAVLFLDKKVEVVVDGVSEECLRHTARVLVEQPVLLVIHSSEDAADVKVEHAITRHDCQRFQHALRVVLRQFLRPFDFASCCRCVLKSLFRALVHFRLSLESLLPCHSPRQQVDHVEDET